MTDAPISLLLVEDDAVEAGSICASLGNSSDPAFNVEWMTRLSDADALLNHRTFEVILLDLTLPDSQGIEVFNQVLQAAPQSMIVILSEAGEEAIAHQAVERGAHDYLIKGHVDAHWLPRALNYLIERKATRDALRISEARFRAMSDASPLGIFVADAQGGCVYTNAAYHKISGLTFEQSLGTNWSRTIHPEDRSRVLSEWRESAFGLASFQTEFRFLREDGSVVWTRVNSSAIGVEKELKGRVLTVEDITERKAIELGLQVAEAALFAEMERAQVTLNSIGDAVLTTDVSGNVTYLNQVAETMTGWTCQEALGRPFSEVFKIIDGATRLTGVNPAQLAISQDKTVGLSVDCVLIRRDGLESAIEDSAAPIHDRTGQVTGAVIVFHDVSESRSMAMRMSHLAQHDFLTDLPNRVLLTERLSRAIGLADRHRKQIALLFLDLDYFKHINDSLGHAIGDRLLQSVAIRLVAGVRATDTVCRQGGDEFVILLAEIDHPRDAALVAEKLLAAFAMPHIIDEHELHVSLSIGISVYPDDGDNVDSVMQNADTAMFHAKASGRNNYQFFKIDMNTRAVRRLAVESSLRRAMKQGEFLLHYQPKVNMTSGLITGAEALIRWLDPVNGLVYPGQFVPIAEECGLIVPIGQWVLREACGQVQAWLDSGLTAVPVSVNISAVEFRHKGFLEGIATILKDTGLAPNFLELELTESILMHDAEASACVLMALKAMGVRLAIDDFGTGYSSLSYLKRFPIDTLKIDQSFVRDIATDNDDATIVSAIIGMGRNLKQRVIAEGVETQQQLDFLLARNCEEGQGFQLGYPLPSNEFARLLFPAGQAVIQT
jgi:diguanylate cyclase (GGDEF)-like protein/PAS domain S-box-containing protein